MLAASSDTFASLGTLLTAIALLITTITGTVATLRGQAKGRNQAKVLHAEAIEKVEAVHDEVKTMNEGTVGSFAADDETRRIEAIPHDQRTSREQYHVDTAPPLAPPQGPAR